MSQKKTIVNLKEGDILKTKRTKYDVLEVYGRCGKIVFAGDIDDRDHWASYHIDDLIELEYYIEGGKHESKERPTQ